PRNVLPKPFTKPHPPMWVAAGNPGTFEKAARMGLGVLCFTMGSPQMLAPLVEVYKNTIEKAEPVGEYVNNNVMVTSQMLCVEALETFGTHVIPQFDKDPLHSTTRQREGWLARVPA